MLNKAKNRYKCTEKNLFIINEILEQGLSNKFLLMPRFPSGLFSCLFIILTLCLFNLLFVVYFIFMYFYKKDFIKRYKNLESYISLITCIVYLLLFILSLFRTLKEGKDFKNAFIKVDKNPHS